MADSEQNKPQTAAEIDEIMAEAGSADDSPDTVPMEAPTVTAAELKEAQDRFLRAQAELDNYRKRARRELEDERRYANMPILRDLLPVVDNISRAIAAATKSPDPTTLLEGFKMVAQQLDGVMERNHCTRIKALHEPFDPHQHDAILQQPSTEFPPNTVINVTQDGFRLHDRVVRPAQVIVSKEAGT